MEMEDDTASLPLPRDEEDEEEEGELNVAFQPNISDYSPTLQSSQRRPQGLEQPVRSHTLSFQQLSPSLLLEAADSGACRSWPATWRGRNGVNPCHSPLLSSRSAALGGCNTGGIPPNSSSTPNVSLNGSPAVPRNPWSSVLSRTPPNGSRSRSRSRSKEPRPKPNTMPKPLRRSPNKFRGRADTPVQAVFDAVWPLDDLDRLGNVLNASANDNLANSRLGPLQDTPLHWAARHGRSGASQLLLTCGAEPLTPNRLGQLPLHLACASGHISTSRLLLVAANALDVADAHDASRCARLRAHVPAPLPPYTQSPGNNTTSILLTPTAYLDPLARLLGRRKLPPANSISPGETPLHTACRAGSTSCIKLLLDHDADPLRPGCGGDPPLVLAARSGRPDAIKTLLDAGVSVMVANPRGVTALHAAAESSSQLGYGPACLQLLLENGAVLDAQDVKGKTPAMYAAAAGALQNLRFLVECGASLAAQHIVSLGINNGAATDHDGSTMTANVLHSAAKARNPDCLLYILRLMLAARHRYVAPSGESTLAPSSQEQELLGLFPSLQEEWTSGETTLQVALARAPSLVDPLLDACLLPQEGEPNKMLLDLALFRAPPRRSEAALLLTLPQKARQKVLAHPLAQTLLTLKWRRVRPLFWLLAALHLLFLLMMGLHIVLAHGQLFGAEEYPTNDTDNHVVSAPMKLAGDSAKYLSLGFTFLLILLEVLKVVRAGKRYVRWDDNGREHLLNWTVLGLAIVELVSPLNSNWQRVIAALLSITSCIQFLGLMSRLPRVGIYVVMMQHVQRSLLPFLVAYFWLFLGFAIALHVLLFEKPDCANPALSLLKTLIMFVGEYNYPQVFETDDPVTTTASNILLAVFIPTMTILLLNLVVGLAVSDIQRLFQEAQYHRQVRLAQAVLYLEALLPPGTSRLVTDSVLNFRNTITVQVDPSDPEGDAWLQMEEPAGLKELVLPFHVAEGLRRLLERRWGIFPTMAATPTGGTTTGGTPTPMPFHHMSSMRPPTPTTVPSTPPLNAMRESNMQTQIEQLLHVTHQMLHSLQEVRSDVKRLSIAMHQQQPHIAIIPSSST